MGKILIVIDMQNDFITGSLGSSEARAIVPNVKKKIMEYQNNNDCVIFTMDTHDTSYLNSQEGRYLPVEHCIEGTDGWEILKCLDIPEQYHIMKNSFGWPLWKNIDFQNSDEIEIVGVCTDICVVSNALILKAMFPEMKITVDAECCAGVTPERHQAALLTMKSCQINIVGE